MRISCWGELGFAPVDGEFREKLFGMLNPVRFLNGEQVRTSPRLLRPSPGLSVSWGVRCATSQLFSARAERRSARRSGSDRGLPSGDAMPEEVRCSALSPAVGLGCQSQPCPRSRPALQPGWGLCVVGAGRRERARARGRRWRCPADPAGHRAGGSAGSAASALGFPPGAVLVAGRGAGRAVGAGGVCGESLRGCWPGCHGTRPCAGPGPWALGLGPWAGPRGARGSVPGLRPVPRPLARVPRGSPVRSRVGVFVSSPVLVPSPWWWPCSRCPQGVPAVSPGCPRVSPRCPGRVPAVSPARPLCVVW